MKIMFLIYLSWTLLNFVFCQEAVEPSIKIEAIFNVFPDNILAAHQATVSQLKAKQSMDNFLAEILKKEEEIIKIHEKYYKKINGYPILKEFKLNPEISKKIYENLNSIKNSKSEKIMGDIAGCFFNPNYIFEIKIIDLNKEIKTAFYFLDCRDIKSEIFACSTLKIGEMKNGNLVYIEKYKIDNSNKEKFIEILDRLKLLEEK